MFIYGSITTMISLSDLTPLLALRRILPGSSSTCMCLTILGLDFWPRELYSIYNQKLHCDRGQGPFAMVWNRLETQYIRINTNNNFLSFHFSRGGHMSIVSNPPAAGGTTQWEDTKEEKQAAGGTAQREYTSEEKLIIQAIHRKYPDASDFRFAQVGSEFADGNTYSAVFTTSEINDDESSWYYAYVDASGAKLLDDGEKAIVFMQALLEKRKSILQRLKDFDFLDIIGACIALPIIFAFVYIVVTAKGTANAVSNEFLAIVSLILGYYFGRNK